ncbi:MAG: prolyl oligopeptidase family serine peptidase [Verrucomicrobiota bacterium]
MNAQTNPPDKIQSAKKFSKEITRTVGCQYLISLPKNYDKESKLGFPLILFLHGAGERGDDVWRASIHGPSKYAAEHPEFPFILVTPQCPADGVWSNEVLLELLDEVIAKNNVDQKRIYLTGLSMGGYGAWNLGLAHPEKFAALAPICGGGERIEILLAARGYVGPVKLQTLRALPVWAFHGAKDPVVPLEESERMIKALKEAKCMDVKLTVYPEAQHDSWTETYSNPKLYQWFLAHEGK